MKLQHVIALIAALFTVPAVAEFRTVIEAIETSPVLLEVPTSQNSRLSFRSCDGCDRITARLTPDTQFFVNAEGVKFGEFRKQVTNRRNGKDDYALVRIDKETNTVTSIEVAD